MPRHSTVLCVALHAPLQNTGVHCLILSCVQQMRQCFAGQLCQCLCVCSSTDCPPSSSAVLCHTCTHC